MRVVTGKLCRRLRLIVNAGGAARVSNGRLTILTILCYRVTKPDTLYILYIIVHYNSPCSEIIVVNIR